MDPEGARSAVLATLDRFDLLISARGWSLLSLFATDADAMLAASEVGDLARGPEAIREHLAMVFRSPARLSFEWRSREASVVGEAAWIFANGELILRGPAGEERTPYRLTVVLERRGDEWLWRHFHGSQPRPDR